MNHSLLHSHNTPPHKFTTSKQFLIYGRYKCMQPSILVWKQVIYVLLENFSLFKLEKQIQTFKLAQKFQVISLKIPTNTSLNESQINKTWPTSPIHFWLPNQAPVHSKLAISVSTKEHLGAPINAASTNSNNPVRHEKCVGIQQVVAPRRCGRSTLRRLSPSLPWSFPHSSPWVDITAKPATLLPFVVVYSDNVSFFLCSVTRKPEVVTFNERILARSRNRKDPRNFYY